MAVKHRRVRLQTNLVGHAGGIEPLVAVDLVVANDVTHAVSKNLCTPAGKRIHSRGLELFQGLADRKLRALRQIRHFNHGESFEMYLWKALLQSQTEVEKILKGQIRMQSPDNVKLSDSFGVSRCCRLKSVFERHGVGAGRIFLAAECAKSASGNAHVRRVDVAVDVEISLVAVHAFANVVGHPAHGQDVSGAIERQRVVCIKTFPDEHFVANRREPSIIGLKGMLSRHLPDDIAGPRDMSQEGPDEMRSNYWVTITRSFT